jgi:hypothetical protein
MQGKKYYQPKLFNNYNLSDRIPKNNFYRELKEVFKSAIYLHEDTIWL